MTDTSLKLLGGLAAACQAAWVRPPLLSSMYTLRRAPDEAIGVASGARSAGEAGSRLAQFRCARLFPLVADRCLPVSAQARLATGTTHLSH